MTSYEIHTLETEPRVYKTNKQTNSEIILIAPSNIYPYILLCLYETGRIFGATQYSLHIRL